MSNKKVITHCIYCGNKLQAIRARKRLKELKVPVKRRKGVKNGRTILKRV